MVLRRLQRVVGVCALELVIQTVKVANKSAMQSPRKKHTWVINRNTMISAGFLSPRRLDVTLDHEDRVHSQIAQKPLLQLQAAMMKDGVRT